MPNKPHTAPTKKARISYSVRKVFQASPEMEKRITLYCKSKGINAPTMCIMAVNDFLSLNNF